VRGGRGGRGAKTKNKNAWGKKIIAWEDTRKRTTVSHVPKTKGKKLGGQVRKKKGDTERLAIGRGRKSGGRKKEWSRAGGQVRDTQLFKKGHTYFYLWGESRS